MNVPSFDIVAPSNITVELRAEEWYQLRGFGTNEMRSEANGRCLFPALQYGVGGLDPREIYMFTIQMQRVSGEMRWQENEGWTERTALMEDTVAPLESNELQTIAMPGAHWMQNGIDLSFVKIYTIGKKTKNIREDVNMIHLHYQRMYRPVLRILQHVGGDYWNVLSSVSTDLTDFVNVSIYKNQKISKAKTEMNKHSRNYKEKLGHPGNHRSKNSKKPKVKVQETNDLEEIELFGPFTSLIPELHLVQIDFDAEPENFPAF